jgi:hypothetical protein
LADRLTDNSSGERNFSHTRYRYFFTDTNVLWDDIRQKQRNSSLTHATNRRMPNSISGESNDLSEDTRVFEMDHRTSMCELLDGAIQ